MILIMSQFSSCHNIQKMTTTRTKQTYKDLDSRYSWHLSASDPKTSRNEDIEQSYRVSNHAVPGGPNPLHNWIDFIVFFTLILVSLQNNRFCSYVILFQEILYRGKFFLLLAFAFCFFLKFFMYSLTKCTKLPLYFLLSYTLQSAAVAPFWQGILIQLSCDLQKYISFVTYTTLR